MSFMKQYVSKVKNQSSRVIGKKAVITLRRNSRNKIVTLSPQATQIWKNLKGEMAVGSLVKLAAKALHVDYKDNRKDIEACVSQLARERLVLCSAFSKYKKRTYKEINKIEKIYVINLASSPGRKRAMKKRLSAFLSKLNKKIDICFFKAIDWHVITGEYLKRNGFHVFKKWKIAEPEHSYYNRELLRGEIACTLSHFLVWKLMKKERINKALIFEDDAGFCDDLDIIVEELEAALDVLQKKAPDWDFVYLERMPLMADRGSLGEHVVIPGYSYHNFGYIVTEKGIDKLLRANVQKNIVPSDEFISALYCEHPRKDVDKIFGRFNKLLAFSIEPPLLEECAESVTLKSDTFKASR